MPKKRLYDVYEGDTLVIEGTADEVADALHFSPEYVTQQGHRNGMLAQKYTVKLGEMKAQETGALEKVKNDVKSGFKDSVIAQRHGITKNTVQKYKARLRREGKI